MRLAPGMFELVKDGTELFAAVVPGGRASEDELWAAAKGCPWAAVILESDDGQMLYP